MLPLADPSDSDRPSPKFTTVEVMGAEFAPACTFTVKDAGMPTLGVVLGGGTVPVGLAVAVTLAVAVLVPTVAVTVAVWKVFS